MRLPSQIALFDGAPFPWWVAGGWALDLFLGRPTREHDDVEVAVLRRDQERLRAHLEGWSWVVYRAGEPESWNGWIDLPRHELHARRGAEEIEALLNEADADTWHYRRDRRVELPLADAGGTSADGVPFLAPEIVLLFKAKTPRPKDDADFGATLPALEPDRRRWLRAALELAHPERTDWITRLG